MQAASFRCWLWTNGPRAGGLRLQPHAAPPTKEVPPVDAATMGIDTKGSPRLETGRDCGVLRRAGADRSGGGFARDHRPLSRQLARGKPGLQLLFGFLNGLGAWIVLALLARRASTSRARAPRPTSSCRRGWRRSTSAAGISVSSRTTLQEREAVDEAGSPDRLRHSRHRPRSADGVRLSLAPRSRLRQRVARCPPRRGRPARS